MFMRPALPAIRSNILKAEEEIGVAYRVLANLYQHLLEECLTAGAADMNKPNYFPVTSSTQVAGQFPSQAYLFVYIISKAWGRSAGLWRPSIQVLGHQDRKQGVHWPSDFISHASISVLQENSPFCF